MVIVEVVVICGGGPVAESASDLNKDSSTCSVSSSATWTSGAVSVAAFFTISADSLASGSFGSVRVLVDAAAVFNDSFSVTGFLFGKLT